MGYWKEHALEIQGRGYGDAPEKFVCPDCTDDLDLKKFISDNAVFKECSYCGKRFRKEKSIHLRTFIEYIMECITTEWCDVESSGAMYISREGGWQCPISWKDELFSDYIDLNHTELFNDIIDIIEIDRWSKNWLDRDDDDIASEVWYQFTNLIKHRLRFTAFHKSAQNLFKNEYYEDPNFALNMILKSIEELDMVHTISKNKPIYRARKSNLRYDYNSAKQLGTVPTKCAIKANRMSPVGIPIFYGCFDKEIAKKEIMYDDEKYFLHLATFKSNRDLVLIDFTKKILSPSIFSYKRYLRSQIRFITSFSKEISLPLKKDSIDHIDYLPSQVITEYLRYDFLFKDKNIDGIIYNSAYGNVKCCVLFVDNDHCILDSDKMNNDKLYLILKHYKQYIPKRVKL